MSQVTETPAQVRTAATQEDALPHRKLTLLGTYVKPDGAQALIRTASGKIAMVAKGDRIGSSTVLAIAPGELVLQRGNSAVKLKLPGS